MYAFFIRLFGVQRVLLIVFLFSNALIDMANGTPSLLQPLRDHRRILFAPERIG